MKNKENEIELISGQKKHTHTPRLAVVGTTRETRMKTKIRRRTNREILIGGPRYGQFAYRHGDFLLATLKDRCASKTNRIQSKFCRLVTGTLFFFCFFLSISFDFSLLFSFFFLHRPTPFHFRRRLPIDVLFFLIDLVSPSSVGCC